MGLAFLYLLGVVRERLAFPYQSEAVHEGLVVPYSQDLGFSMPNRSFLIQDKLSVMGYSLLQCTLFVRQRLSVRGWLFRIHEKMVRGISFPVFVKVCPRAVGLSVSASGGP